MNNFVIRKEGPVTVLTLKRPPVNALDRTALEELSKALENVESDRESRVLVLTGGIEGIFCSGGDLKYWRHMDLLVNACDRSGDSTAADRCTAASPAGQLMVLFPV